MQVEYNLSASFSTTYLFSSPAHLAACAGLGAQQVWQLSTALFLLYG